GAVREAAKPPGMSLSEVLYSEQGRRYLQLEYVEKARSTYEGAEDNGTYQNAIRRALLHHEIPLRDKGRAQVIALEDGRPGHPTEGAPRSEEVRKRVGEGVARARRAGYATGGLVQTSQENILGFESFLHDLGIGDIKVGNLVRRLYAVDRMPE